MFNLKQFITRKFRIYIKSLINFYYFIKSNIFKNILDFNNNLYEININLHIIAF